MRKRLSNYFYAKRLQQTTTFFHTLFGVVAVRGWLLSREDIWGVATVFGLFGLLLYGGIYAINNIVDRKSDARTPSKRMRVLASGKINPQLLLADAMLSIASALVLLYLLLPDLFAFGVFLVAINLLYTLVLKKFNRPLATFLISITSAVRVALGVTLAGGDIASFIALYMIVWFGQFTFSVRKIRFEGYIRSAALFSYMILVPLCVIAVLGGGVVWQQRQGFWVVGPYALYYLLANISYRLPFFRRVFRRIWSAS